MIPKFRHAIPKLLQISGSVSAFADDLFQYACVKGVSPRPSDRSPFRYVAAGVCTLTVQHGRRCKCNRSGVSKSATRSVQWNDDPGAWRRVDPDAPTRGRESSHRDPEAALRDRVVSRRRARASRSSATSAPAPEGENAARRTPAISSPVRGRSEIAARLATEYS